MYDPSPAALGTLNFAAGNLRETLRAISWLQHDDNKPGTNAGPVLTDQKT